MDLVQIIEIAALALGVPYIVLEVLQKNSMWYFGIVSSTACAIQFFLQDNWANMGLNVYYVAMAVWGLYQWRKDGEALKARENENEVSDIHLNHLTLSQALWSAAAFLAGTACLIWVLKATNDSSPVLDAVSTSLSIVAMYWLAKSIPYHWLLWIIGDSMLVVMCALSGMLWLTILYAAYVLAAAYGMVRWFKRGIYVS